ncbi:hypothetical protein H5J24_07470 [Chryseobacterium capnotolerans]|uniref:hypothetical protein n=1 Tax=Chryseobacterium capnotolerans TaxID=2759528 RepID=UPI001E5458C2|nr:hypothetical protein [Chryseobacterium capnotolerans]UHO39868.1 hypothetical protein H5J24_07470 [Chryseobacterium capnotolerans]
MMLRCGLATLGNIIALLGSDKTNIPGVVSVAAADPMTDFAVVDSVLLVWAERLAVPVLSILRSVQVPVSFRYFTL